MAVRPRRRQAPLLCRYPPFSAICNLTILNRKLCVVLAAARAGETAGPEPVALLLGGVLAPSGARRRLQAVRRRPRFRRAALHRQDHPIRREDAV